MLESLVFVALGVFAAALLRALVVIARQAGLNHLIAEVLSGNAAMLKVFQKSGLEMRTQYEGPVVHVTLSLARPNPVN